MICVALGRTRHRIMIAAHKALADVGVGLVELRVDWLARNPDGSPRFPADVGPDIYAAAAAVAVLTGLISAVAPAQRAAKLEPATVIRNG